MAQSPAGSSGGGGKGGSSGSGGGKSSSGKGGGKSSSSNSASKAGKEIERLAGKVPAAKADRAQAGPVELKGKWENFPGGKAFQG